MRSFLLFVVGLSPGLFSYPSQGASQELGLSFAASRSDNSELPTPLGFEAHALLELNPAWHFRVSYYRVADETAKEAWVCRHYVPPVACEFEETRASFSLSGLRGGMIRTLHGGTRFRIGAGGGFSFTSLHGKARGVSGLLANLLIPKTGHVGAFGLFSLAFAPHRSTPVRVVSDFIAHWVNFSTCSSAPLPQYDPFCASRIFSEVEVGLSFSF